MHLQNHFFRILLPSAWCLLYKSLFSLPTSSPVWESAWNRLTYLTGRGWHSKLTIAQNRQCTQGKNRRTWATKTHTSHTKKQTGKSIITASLQWLEQVVSCQEQYRETIGSFALILPRSTVCMTWWHFSNKKQYYISSKMEKATVKISFKNLSPQFYDHFLLTKWSHPKHFP